MLFHFRHLRTLVDMSITKEKPIKKFIELSHPVTDSIFKLHTGDFIKALKLEGAAFQSNGNDEINGWDRQFVSMLRGVSSPNMAIHSHIVRREVSDYPGGIYPEGFADNLNNKYRKSVCSGKLLINDLYLTFIYRPSLGAVSKGFNWLLNVGTGVSVSDAEAVDFLEKTVVKAMESLAPFSPKVLGCYEYNDFTFSQPLEYFASLINGEHHRFPLPKGDISRILATSRPYFGKIGDIALSGIKRSVYANVIGIHAYPSKTNPTIFNDLLSLPFEFVLSQTFCFQQKSIASWTAERHQANLVAVADKSKKQTDAIDDALDDLAANEIILGIHSLAMVVYGNSKKDANNNTVKAVAVFSDNGMKVNKEDIAACAGFFSQLPGNFKYRLNPAKITDKNFAHFSSLHNFPIGRISGNQWGDAVTMFKTTSGAPFYFNFHYSEFESSDPNNFEPASTLIVGKVGTGKTVVEGFLISQLQKYRHEKMTCVVFDRDQSVGILIRALGGSYYTLKTGQPSGLNPLQIEPTDTNTSFIVSLVKYLASRNEKLSVDDEKFIFDEVKNVMRMPLQLRKLSAVRNRLRSKSKPIYDALGKWCEGGEFGWLFDNDEDTLLVDCPNVGFDVTEFFGNDEIRSPLMMYLLHRVEMLLDGRRLPIFFEEFGVLLSSDDPVFRQYAKKAVTTYRKKNSFFVGLTQDVSQLSKGGDAGKDMETIINQSSTKIFLPNPLAIESEYVGKFGLTKKEYELIRGFGEKSRQMLIKQGHKSVVAILDLKNGFDDELAVLSSNTRTSRLCEEIIQQHGTDPDVWVPIFQNEVKNGLR